MEEIEPAAQPPMVSATSEKSVTKLRQVTVRADEEIEEINNLLADGWRLVSIGYRPDATVYVLGQMDKKPKARAGFGFRFGGENDQ